MPTYDYECPQGHVFEVRCSIAESDNVQRCDHPVPLVQYGMDKSGLPKKIQDLVENPPDALVAALGVPREFIAPTRACGLAGKRLISAPAIPSHIVVDYPGSKKHKAGYQHSHGDRPGTKIQVGSGGKISYRELPTEKSGDNAIWRNPLGD